MKYRIAGGFSFYERAEIKDSDQLLDCSLESERFGALAADHQLAGPGHRGKRQRTRWRNWLSNTATSIWGAIEIAVGEQRLATMRTIRCWSGF